MLSRLLHLPPMRLAAMAAVASLALAACSRSGRPPVDNDRMAALLVDLNYADAMVGTQYHSTYSSDSLRKLLKQSILAKHGLTQEELDSVLMWYGGHISVYLDVCDRVDSIISDSLRIIDRQIEQLALAGGQTVATRTECWPGRPWQVIAPTQASDFITFSLPADSSWRRGDVWVWGLSMTNARSPMAMTLAVEYAERPGMLELVNQHDLTGTERHELELRTDTILTPVRISGYAFLRPAADEWALADSISLTRAAAHAEGYYRLRRQVIQFPPLRHSR